MKSAPQKYHSKRNKIRNVLLIYYLAPLVILLNASSIYFYFSTKESLDQEFEGRLTSIASFAALQIKPYHVAALSLKNPHGKTAELLRQKLEDLRVVNKIENIYVFNERSESLLDTNVNVLPGSVYERHRLYQVELDEMANQKPSVSTLFQGRDGKYYKTAFAPVVHEGKTLAYIAVDGSAVFFENLFKLSSALTYFGLLCISLVIISSVLVSRKIVQPIETLVQSAEEIGEGNFQTPITLRVENELGFLGYAMDNMRKKMVERDTEFQMMLQGVAHEVRNPLGGIELFAGLLREETVEPKSISHITRIQKEIQSLKQLVQEFLDFARKPSLEIERVQLGSFFEDLRLNFVTELEAKNLKLLLDIQSDIEPMFDQSQIRRVLMNLIHNAIQASSAASEIFIKCCLQNGFFTISVKDTGVGISAENIDKIFNPFFTTKERGSGLGLAFAKKIVEAHGGQLEVESQIGQGSTFHILLPTHG